MLSICPHLFSCVICIRIIYLPPTQFTDRALYHGLLKDKRMMPEMFQLVQNYRCVTNACKFFFLCQDGCATTPSLDCNHTQNTKRLQRLKQLPLHLACRTHTSVLDLASSVLSIVVSLFPGAIDALQPERSNLAGARSGS